MDVESLQGILICKIDYARSQKVQQGKKCINPLGEARHRNFWIVGIAVLFVSASTKG